MERQKQFQKQGIGWTTMVIILCSIFVLKIGSAIAADSILIVSIPKNGAHQRFISSFRVELSRIFPGINIDEKSLDEYDSSNNSSLIVTLGSRAFREVTHQPGKMFHALISHELFKEYYPGDRANKYHLAFNQTQERMLRLHAIALPQSRDIGLLQRYPAPEQISELTREAAKFGKRIVIEAVGDDFSKNLSNLLSKVDSLLLLPDSKVINRSTINSLVLESYHKEIPILGYSKSLVKAGAMLALYSTPEQLGEDAAELVDRIISGKQVPITNYPKQFKVSVNYKLSRVYGISIPSENELHDKIAAGKIE